MTKTIEVSAGVITRLFMEFTLIKQTNARMAFPVLRAMNTTIGDNQKAAKAIDDLILEVRNRHVERDEDGKFKTAKPSIIVPPDQPAPPPDVKEAPDEYVFLTSKEEYVKDLMEAQETLFKIRVTKIPIAATNALMLDTRRSPFQVFNDIMIYDG